MGDGDGGVDADASSGVLRNGRGRRWSDAQKAAIVAESFEPGVVVTVLARRLGLRPEQIHGWRRDVREGRLAAASSASRFESGETAPAFVPVVVAPTPATPSNTAAPIEIEAAGVVVRLYAGADVDLAARIVVALKGRA